MNRPVAFPAQLPVPAEVLRIAERLEHAGHEAWCVGGSVRDALLGEPVGDFDIATSARPEEVQQLFRRTVAVGVRYGTVGVLDPDRLLHEVTTFRHDVQTDGRHAVVQYGASLDDDLARRDLTINAIAYHPLRAEWRDPFGGASDLASGIVRAVGQATDRFREDYLRILRALRFAARLDFQIDDATWAAAREEAAGLGQLSAERVRDEWFKSLRTARSVPRLVELWWESGAAAERLPELRRPHEVAAMHGVSASLPEDRDPVLLTAVLCRSAADVLEQLRASNAEVDRARALHLAPAAPENHAAPAIRRWLSAAGPAADDVIAAAALVDGAAPAWSGAVAAVRQRGDPLTRKALAITGDDLRAAGVPPGPALGRVLDRLLDAVLEDPSLNDRETLMTRARSLL